MATTATKNGADKASAEARVSAPEQAPAETPAPEQAPTDAPTGTDTDTPETAEMRALRTELERLQRAEQRRADEQAAAAALEATLTPAEKRAREARKVAQTQKASPWSLADDCEWIDADEGGQVAVCSRTDARTGVVLYALVHRVRGREVAIGLRTVEQAQEAGQL